MEITRARQEMMTVYEQLMEACQGHEGEILSTGEIKALLAERFGRNPASVQPSDYCYNRWNEDTRGREPLFVQIRPGKYKYVGPEYPYTGEMLWRPKGARRDQVVGEWRNGRLVRAP